MILAWCVTKCANREVCTTYVQAVTCSFQRHRKAVITGILGLIQFSVYQHLRAVWFSNAYNDHVFLDQNQPKWHLSRYDANLFTF